MYREQGEDYLLECMMDLYTTTAELSMIDCVSEVFKKLNPSGTSEMVLTLPAGQSAKKYLSKLKEQLELHTRVPKDPGQRGPNSIAPEHHFRMDETTAKASNGL